MPSADATARTVRFTAADGAQLVGDLEVPPSPSAAAIVCHPHPLYGGDRANAVVVATAAALVTAGIAALRFDFRAEFDHGRGEQLDAAAALDLLDDVFDDLPLLAAGYSFGAMVVGALADVRVQAQILVAPPLGAGGSLEPPTVPTLLLVPAHDQFAPPDVIAPIVERWRGDDTSTPVEWQVIESTDHSITGRTGWVGERAADWLSASTG